MTFIYKSLVVLYTCFLFCNPAEVDASPLTLQQGEITIRGLFDRLPDYHNDRDKKLAADSITIQLGELLAMAGSFEYPFNALNKLGKITSPDHQVRIYTWNLPGTDGTNTYYGFLQYKTENKKDIRITALTDKSDTMQDPLEKTLGPGNWYGMLVYDIIEKESENKVYYTLLGYDNESLFLSRKITDVLYFDEHREPFFGKPIFSYHGRNLCRIFFEYSAKVQMSLKWNDKLKMIVFDHLSPLNSSYTGNYQYYGPDLSFDALKFENGRWEVVENVDVRN